MQEEKIQSFSIHANTIIDFNRLLITGSCSDRDGLGIEVTELLYNLLAKWSGYNQTLQQWLHAEWKDLGNMLFIHAYNEPASIMLQIGINWEGIYLQMTIDEKETFENCLPENVKSHLLEVSQLGKFEISDDNNDFLIMWPYENFSVIDIASNGSIAFSLMYALCLEPNKLEN
ncbi:hypothetical protein [Chitinophaga ginsengisoli]|uniref:Uncharacterized protein n=1 Tax=Chitinophaga ginsengisoli TaxID=363837 RepID=A0A2P8FBY6_9BACT|nr:hypothetical protein [Chitinophaga ginsengisoli]PSL19204.1 hypothetical protein CLV42_1292 [Chitinophaga ginsengisoli]